MIDYNSWKRIKLKPTNLKLDDENLRLSGFDKKPSTRDIIHYMINNENILKLAKSIVQKGFFPNEEPIVYKDGSHYVVVEGNRRVTACKLLIQPSMAPTRKIKSFERLSKGFNLEIIRSLYCRVAPSKEEADILIENRHTNTEIEKWDRIKQYRFYYLKHESGKSVKYLSERFNRTESDIGKMIRRYEMFKIAKGLELDEYTEGVLENEPKLDITNLERFYESRQGRDFLGLKFDQNGVISHTIPKTEFIKRFSRVVEDFGAGNLNSRNYGNNDDQNEKFIADIFKSEADLNPSIRQSDDEIEYNLENENPIKTTAKEEEQEKPPKSSGNSSSTIIPKTWTCNTDVERINKICNELQKMTLGSKPNASLVLFRSFLEMVTYQYLEGKGVIQEVKKQFGQEQKKSVEKHREKVKNTLTADLSVNNSLLTGTKLKKLIPDISIKKDWTPSLFRMLSYIASSDTSLTKSPKMKEGLNQYLKRKGELLTHHDFNLFVHNEYSITPTPKEINEVWGGIKPLLKFMLEELDIHKQKAQEPK